MDKFIFQIYLTRKNFIQIYIFHIWHNFGPLAHFVLKCFWTSGTRLEKWGNCFTYKISRVTSTLSNGQIHFSNIFDQKKFYTNLHISHMTQFWSFGTFCAKMFWTSGTRLDKWGNCFTYKISRVTSTLLNGQIHFSNIFDQKKFYINLHISHMTKFWSFGTFCAKIFWDLWYQVRQMGQLFYL